VSITLNLRCLEFTIGIYDMYGSYDVVLNRGEAGAKDPALGISRDAVEENQPLQCTPPGSQSCNA
jgi:hypothetical protein